MCPLLPGPVQIAAAVPTTYRKSSTKTVNTTVSATDLLNGEITLAGAVLGIDRMLRLTAWGDNLNNSGGSSPQPRFQLILGGTTLLDTGSTAAALGNSASRNSWVLNAEIMNTGSASAQLAALRIFLSCGLAGASLGNVFTTGLGEFAGISNGGGVQSGIANGVNTTAVNTVPSLALVLNVINGSASASYETRLFGAVVEIV